MARFRLRFQLQEVDLPPGETLIGRSLDCQVTIEDPLVSRQHARIIVVGDDATVEDLGSRNGVKINGLTVRTPTSLNDGDRLRIGTQDLVVSRVEPATSPAHTRATGVLRLCANCKLPYPRELVACPNCEATEQEDEETLSGTFNRGAQQSWSVQLLIEALERALNLGMHTDADRILRRASTQIEEGAAHGEAIDPKQLAAVAAGALTVAIKNEDVTWGGWVLRVYRGQKAFLPASLFDRLSAVVHKAGDALTKDMDDLLVELRRGDRSLTPEEAQSLARLEELRATGAGPRTAGGVGISN